MDELRTPPAALVPPTRPEYLRDTIVDCKIGVVQKPLTLRQRLANQNWLRKTLGPFPDFTGKERFAYANS